MSLRRCCSNSVVPKGLRDDLGWMNVEERRCAHGHGPHEVMQCCNIEKCSSGLNKVRGETFLWVSATSCLLC